MNKSKNGGRRKTMVFIGTVLTIIALVLFFSEMGSQPPKTVLLGKQYADPVVSVETVPLQRRDFHRTLQAYGSVSPLPETTRGVALAYQCRVLVVMVTTGQAVGEGEPLIRIAPGPEAFLRLKQSESRVASLHKELAMLTERVRLKLATQQDLIRMKTRAQQAAQELETLKKQGIGKKTLIRANGSGIVSSIDVSEGDIVATGGRLLQIVQRNRMVAVFGVEIEERSLLKVGQAVRIHMVQTPLNQSVTGIIQAISHAVNPSTRLIMVTAIPDHPDDLYLNAFVEVEFEIHHRSVFVVPVNAVLPTKNEYKLFTVVNRRAILHNVRVVMKNASFAEVAGEGLREGDQVVTLGNYELHDGMDVKGEVRP